MPKLLSGSKKSIIAASIKAIKEQISNLEGNKTTKKNKIIEMQFDINVNSLKILLPKLLKPKSDIIIVLAITRIIMDIRARIL